MGFIPPPILFSSTRLGRRRQSVCLSVPPASSTRNKFMKKLSEGAFLTPPKINNLRYSIVNYEVGLHQPGSHQD